MLNQLSSRANEESPSDENGDDAEASESPEENQPQKKQRLIPPLYFNQLQIIQDDYYQR